MRLVEVVPHLLPLCLLAALVRASLASASASASQSQKPYSYTEVACVNRLCRCNSNTVTCSCAGKIEQVMNLQNKTYPDDMKFLKVENCGTVNIEEDAFAGLKHLAVINISNVANLDVAERGFRWKERFDPSTPVKGIIINLVNVTIEELPASAFSGNLDAVIMSDVLIRNMRTFAFTDVWKIGRIEMTRFEITIMEESVAKKMEVKSLLLTDGVIRGLVPSRAFTDIEVASEFVLENVQFHIIQSRAFSMRIGKALRVRGCTVAQLRTEAFVMAVHDKAIFERNVFGAVDMRALARITPDRPPPHMPNHHGVTFIFENNTIGDFQDGALEIQDGFREVRMERVVLKRTCSCEELDRWRRRLVTRSPAGEPGSKMLEASALWCHVESTKGRRRPTPIEDFYRLACVDAGWDLPAVLITAALVAAAVLCLVGVGTLFCRRQRLRRLKRSKEPTKGHNGIPLKRVHSSKGTRTPGDGASHLADGGDVEGDDEEARPLKMIVPDGRTYRETELHVIVERAEPLPDDRLTKPIGGIGSPRKASGS